MKIVGKRRTCASGSCLPEEAFRRAAVLQTQAVLACGVCLSDKCPVTIDQIRERMAEGVEPFLLRLSDGRKIEVPHPDFIAVGGNVVVVVDQSGASKKIDAHHIVSVEDVPAPHRKKASSK